MTRRVWFTVTLMTTVIAAPAGASDGDDRVDAPQINPPRQATAPVDPGPREPAARSPYIEQPAAPAPPRRGDLYGGPEAAAKMAGPGLEYLGNRQPKAESPQAGSPLNAKEEADALALPMDGGIARNDPDFLVRELGGTSDGARQSRAVEESGVGQDAAPEPGIELLPDSGLYLILPQDSQRPPVVVQSPGR